MSAVKYFFVCCDTCGAKVECSKFATAKAARDYMGTKGWFKVGPKDFCRECGNDLDEGTLQ